MNRLVGGPVGLDEPPAGPGMISARALYAATADPEASYTSAEAVDALRYELAAWTGGGHQDLATPDRPVQNLATAEQRAAAWAADERQRVGVLFEATAFDTLFVQRAVLGVAPLALVTGAWLQWLNSPANCHDDVALTALTLYASDMHVGSPGPCRGQAFLALLGQLQLADYAWPAARLVHDRRVPDDSFRLPAILLAMSRRPDEFLPELLGADLCLRNVGVLPTLGAVRLPSDVHPDWAALDPSLPLDDELPGGLAQSHWAVEQFNRGASVADRSRLLAGFRWALGSLQAWSDSLRHQLAGVHPEQEMAELVRHRAREGAIYHHGFTLDGRSLGSRMEEACRARPAAADGRPGVEPVGDARERRTEPAHHRPGERDRPDVPGLRRGRPGRHPAVDRLTSDHTERAGSHRPRSAPRSPTSGRRRWPDRTATATRRARSGRPTTVSNADRLPRRWLGGRRVTSTAG